MHSTPTHYITTFLALAYEFERKCTGGRIYVWVGNPGACEFRNWSTPSFSHVLYCTYESRRCAGEMPFSHINSGGEKKKGHSLLFPALLRAGFVSEIARGTQIMRPPPQQRRRRRSSQWENQRGFFAPPRVKFFFFSFLKKNSLAYFFWKIFSSHYYNTVLGTVHFLFYCYSFPNLWLLLTRIIKLFRTIYKLALLLSTSVPKKNFLIRFESLF